MISGDSIFGIEEVKNIVGTNDISDQFDSNPITRVDGDSRRTKTIDEGKLHIYIKRLVYLNLHRFLSIFRLTVSNLPPRWTGPERTPNKT